MKAFVEFRPETSYTKFSSNAELKTLLKIVPYGLVFILLAYFVIRF